MKKYKFKDYVEAIMQCWLYIIYLLLIVLFFGGIFAYNYWLADGDIKCMLAQDTATCAAIKANGKKE